MNPTSILVDELIFALKFTQIRNTLMPLDLDELLSFVYFCQDLWSPGTCALTSRHVTLSRIAAGPIIAVVCGTQASGLLSTADQIQARITPRYISAQPRSDSERGDTCGRGAEEVLHDLETSAVVSVPICRDKRCLE